MRQILGTWAIALVVGLCASGSAAASISTDWLAGQAQTDGSYAGSADISTSFQATAETLTAFSTLNEFGQPGVPAARAYLSSDLYTGTEHLSRRILAKLQAGQSVVTLIADLKTRQNADGGFGEQPGFDSTILDTSLALEALALGGDLKGTAAGAAISYLAPKQKPDGSWQDVTQSSVYLTSLALKGLWHYRAGYNLGTAISQARAYLLSQRGTNSLWEETYLTAQSLIAILPTLTDRSSVQPSVDALASTRLANGSFENDVFVTALAARALELANRPAADEIILSGRALDGDTGLPLSGVLVSLSGTQSATQVTGAPGTFEFRALAAGPYGLNLSKVGYGALTTNTSLNTGDRVNLGDLQLLVQQAGATTGTVRGTISDSSSGQAIAGAMIGTSGGQGATSAADGTYQISNVPAGQVSLSVAADGYGTASGAGNVPAGGILVFSPHLSSGIQSGGSVLFGVITNAATNAPVEGASVQVTGANTATDSTDANGHYRFDGLAPGDLAIAVTKSGYDSVTAETVLHENATIQFSPRLYAQGTSPADANTASVEGVVIDATTNAPVVGANVTASWAEGTRSLQTDGQGRFAVSGINTADVDLTFAAAGFDPADVSIPVAPAATVDIGEVRLRPQGVTTLIADLRLVSVDGAGTVIDAQTLAVSGVATAAIENNGTAEASGFSLIAFIDLNQSGHYEAGDTLLGSAQGGALAADGDSTINIPLSGFATFRDAPIHVWIDSTEVTAESDEGNNVGSTADQCRITIPQQIVPTLKWHWSSSTTLPNYVQVMMAPAVAQTNDDNQDGKIDINDVPDVIFVAHQGSGSAADQSDGILRIISGANGTEIAVNTGSGNRFSGYGNLAVGDIDGDGLIEIVGPRQGGGLIAFEHNGAFKWSRTFGVRNFGGPAIADIDGDGTPEIAMGNRMLNADGTIRWTGVGGFTFGGPLDLASLSIIANIDGQGGSELIVGASAYSSSGQLLWKNTQVGDGFTAVGNFDADPEAEIVVVNVSSGIKRVSVLEHTGVLKWGPVTVPGGGRGGAPTVADMDGDGQPEIGVAGLNRYVVIETNGSIKWQATIQDSTSHMTGSSVFDFDGDGDAEIVYADETRLRILDGKTGTLVSSIVNSSGTALELPVVADVDNDGRAEIVVTSNRYFGNGPGSTVGVRVFQDANDSWMPTRSIWNQHSYHITNVNDDGTIPAVEQASWLNHNSYRLNTFLDRDPLDSTDLTAGHLRIIDVAAGQPVKLMARVGNAGRTAPSTSVPVRFYEGNPAAGGSLLGTVSVVSLDPGHYQDVELNGVTGLSGTQDIHVVVDPLQNVPECDEANNAHHIPFHTESALGEISVATDETNYGPNTDAILLSASINAGSFPNTFNVELQVLDVNGAQVVAFGPESIGSLPAGGTASFDQTWNTTTTLSGNYSLRGILRRDDGTLLDEAMSSFTIGSGQAQNASLRTTTDRPVYSTTDRVEIGNLARNLTVNQPIPDARLRIIVSGPSGQVVLTTAPDDIALGELSPGSVRERNLTQVLSAAPQGVYQVSGSLRDGAGAILATASASYQVTENQALTITGTVVAQNAVVLQGESQSCTDTVTNRGTQSVSSLLVRQTLARLDQDQTISQTQTTLNLAAGATDTLLRAFSTSSLAQGDYACALEAYVNDAWKGLDNATFHVDPPSIRVNADLALGSKGRILILLDPPAANGDQKDPLGPDVAGAPLLNQQRAYLENLLESEGWSYTIVTSEAAFVQAFRSGAYSVYALLSETVKLAEQFQKEFREAIYRGEGLLDAGGHDERNNKLDEALGVKVAGKSTKPTGIDLLASGISSGGLAYYPLSDKTLRAALTGAQAQGSAADTGLELNPVTTFDYGDGKSVYGGFDLLLQATKAGPGLFSELTTKAPVYVQPLFEAKTGRVVPVRLVLVNDGIPTQGRVVFTLPSGSVVEDAGLTTITGQYQLTWNYVLPDDGTATVTFWLRLPSNEGSATVHASIQVGASGSFTQHTTADLTFDVVKPPSVDKAIEKTDPNSHDGSTDLTWISEELGAITMARVHQDLENAKAAIEQGDYETAVGFLISASDELALHVSEQANQVRRMIADALFEVGQMLP